MHRSMHKCADAQLDDHFAQSQMSQMPHPLSYVPLWCKSNGSFLEGASHPEELVDQAAALGVPAIALTDRDGVYGLVRAHVRAKECGIHLLAGAQVTVDDPAGISTIVLLAQHQRG